MLNSNEAIIGGLVMHPETRYLLEGIDRKRLGRDMQVVLDLLNKYPSATPEEILLKALDKGVDISFINDAPATQGGTEAFVRHHVDETNRIRFSELMAKLSKQLEIKQVEITEAIEQVLTMQQTQVSGVEIKEAKTVANELVDVAEQLWADNIQTLSFPWRNVDRHANSLWGGELLVIAGRPSMGKTAFMLNLAELWARSGKRVGFISLEMKATELVLRSCQKLFDRPLNKALKTLNAQDKKTLYSYLNEFSDLPLFISDSGKATLASIAVGIRNMVFSKKVEVVIVDYLQLIRASGAANRDQEIGTITRTLKELAMELDIPIIVGAQLNRATDHQEKGRPTLNNLRESGNIEQDADTIFFVYRPEYYGASEDPKELQLLIAKQRNGLCGIAMLDFDKNRQKIVDGAWDYEGN